MPTIWKDVLRLILRQGLRQIATGAVAGLGPAVLLARGLQIVLSQVDSQDPTVFAGIVGMLLLTGMLATLVPAGPRASVRSGR